MSRYDVRRRTLQRKAQLNQLTLQQNADTINKLVTQGTTLVNNIATTIGTEQAEEYNRGKYDTIYGQVMDPDFYYKEEGGVRMPLTQEEAFAKYEGLIADYEANNPPPSNPWAQAAIRNSDEKMRDSNRIRLLTNQISTYREFRANRYAEEVFGSDAVGGASGSGGSSSGVGSKPGILNLQIDNPNEFVDRYMITSDSDMEMVSDDMAGVYSFVRGYDPVETIRSATDPVTGSGTDDIAEKAAENIVINSSGIRSLQGRVNSQMNGYTTPDGKHTVGNKNVAAKIFGTYITGISGGYSDVESSQMAWDMQNRFADQELKQNMDILYSTNVLRGSMTEADFSAALDERLDSIAAGGMEGYSRSLTQGEKDLLRREIMSSVSGLKSEYQKQQLGILNDSMMPIMREYEKDNGYITSELFDKLAQQYGLDTRWLPEENRTAIETLLVNNDTLKEAENMYTLLEENAASLKSEEEKQIEYDRIMSETPFGARSLLRSIEDDTNITGKYALVTSDEMVSDLRKTFSIVSQTNFIGNAEQDPAESMTVSDNIIKELTEDPDAANLMASMAAYYTEKKEGMPVQFTNKLHVNSVDAFLDTLPEDERADAEKGLGRIYDVNEATGQRKLIGYVSASKEWEDRYYKWFDEQCAYAASFISVYGNRSIGSQTLSSLYDDLVYEIGRNKRSLAAGYIVDPTDNEIYDSSQASSQFIRLFNEATNQSRKDSLELLTHDRRFMMQFTKEDRDRIINAINNDIVAYAEEKGYDLNAMADDNMPSGLKGTYMEDIVKASAIAGIDTKTIDQSTGDAIEARLKDSIQNLVNAMYGENIIQLSSGETYSEEIDSFKGYYNEYVTDSFKDNVNKLLFGDTRLEGIDQLLVDLNTKYGFDFDAIIHKSESSGLWAKYGDLNDRERFLMALSLINNIDYNPGENDDKVWDDITRLADLNGNLWLETNAIAAQAVVQYADNILRINEMPFIEPIAFNGNDLGSILAEMTDGTQVLVSTKVNTRGDIVNYMVDTDTTGKNSEDKLPFERSETEVSVRDLNRIGDIARELAQTIDVNEYRGYDPVLEPERYSSDLSNELTERLYEEYPYLPQAYKMATGRDLVVNVSYPNIVWIDPVTTSN